MILCFFYIQFVTQKLKIIRYDRWASGGKGYE